MIKRLLFIVGLGIIAASVGTYSPAQAAFNIYGPDTCTSADAKTSTTCASVAKNTGTDPLAGNDGILSKIANIVAEVAGAAAVIVLILGAIRFITSNGSAQDQSGKPSEVTMAKKMITGALIGLVIIALARTMIYYLVHHLKP